MGVMQCSALYRDYDCLSLSLSLSTVGVFNMVVRLRLAMHGPRNSRIFHLVAINAKQRRDAKPLEILGIYRNRLKPDEKIKSVEWSVDRIKYWLGVGAIPSDSVTRLLEKVCNQCAVICRKVC